MAENKKSVLLYCDIIHTVEKLNNTTAGKLFKHYLRYINDLNPTTDSEIVDIVFEPIKQTLKRDLRKYEDKCTKNKENVLKRWNKKDTTVNDGKNGNTNDTDKDKGNDKEKEKDINIKDSQFKKDLSVYVDTYGKDMLNDFYIHWSEPNKSKTKLKWEMEKTWDLSRRLKKWESNAIKWSKGNGKSRQNNEGFEPEELRELSESIANDDRYK